MKVSLTGLKMHNSEHGFTLIELVMVIVILGILSAFALPRFADLGGDARAAVREGVIGSMKSAASIAHSKCIVDSGCDQSSTGQQVTLEGAVIDMDFGHPSMTDQGIGAAAQLSDFTTTPGRRSRGNRVGGGPDSFFTLKIDGRDDCTVTYAIPNLGGSPVFGGEKACN